MDPALCGRSPFDGNWCKGIALYKKQQRTYILCCCFVLTKATPGYAGGEKELIARGGVDKKKSPS